MYIPSSSYKIRCYLLFQYRYPNLNGSLWHISAILILWKIVLCCSLIFLYFQCISALNPLIYVLNTCPVSDPWGSQLLTSLYLEKQPLITTLCFLSLSYFLIHNKDLPLTLWLFIFRNSFLSRILSQAFVKPSKLYLPNLPPFSLFL